MRWTEKGGGVLITGRNDDDLMSGLAIERTVTAQWVSFGLLTLAMGFHYQNGVQMIIPTWKAPHLDARRGYQNLVRKFHC